MTKLIKLIALFVLLNIVYTISLIAKSNNSKRQNLNTLSSLPIKKSKNITTPNLWLSSNNINTDNNIFTWKNHSLNDYLIKPIDAKTPSLNTNIINYNPAITFDGNDWLEKTNINGGTLLDKTNNTIFIVQKMKSGVVSFQYGIRENNRLECALKENKLQFSYPNDKNKGNTIISQKDIKNKWGIHELITNSTEIELLINGIHEQKKLRKNEFNIAPKNNTLSIGKNITTKVTSKIEIAEIIIFNKNLDVSERHIWESYLAIKYGITLNNGKTKYYSGNGDVIWYNDSNFSHNIFGIGKDEMINQQNHISKNLTNNDIVISTKNNFTTNNLEKDNILNDNEYLIIGDNNEKKTWNTDQNILHSKKTWRILNNRVSNIYLKFNLSDYPQEDEYYLLIDDDNNLDNGIYNYKKIDNNCITSLLNIKEIPLMFLSIAPKPFSVSLGQINPICEQSKGSFFIKIKGGKPRYKFIIYKNSIYCKTIITSKLKMNFSLKNLKNNDSVKIIITDEKGYQAKDSIQNITVHPLLHTKKIEKT